MYTFYLDAELEEGRNIADIKGKYRVYVGQEQDMTKAFFEHSTNFFEAAHRVAEYLLETDHPSIAELDTYFFALAFLYRDSNPDKKTNERIIDEIDFMFPIYYDGQEGRANNSRKYCIFGGKT